MSDTEVIVLGYRYRPELFSPAKSEAEAQEELLDIYKRAVKRHLLSDVPVGLLLSGGVDSALLPALMNLYPAVLRHAAHGLPAPRSARDRVE